MVAGWIRGIDEPSVAPLLETLRGTLDSFVEIGFNVSVLLGSKVEFTSLQVRTPQDIILHGFRHLGHWAQGAKLGGRQ